MKHVPAIARWLPSYDRSWLKSDLASGINVWAVLIPTSVAYTSLVGIAPIYGLFCVPGALIAYAIFGGSKLMVVGPDALVAVLAGATIAAVGLSGQEPLLAAILAIIAGLILLTCFVLRLGWIADLIPDPVLKGMIEGIVWTTILKEAVVLLGLELEGGNGSFLAKLPKLLVALPQTHLPSLAVGAGSLLALIALRRFAPKLPGPLIMLIGVLIANALVGFEAHGIHVIGDTSGKTSSLDLAKLPPLDKLAEMLPGALAIAVIGFTLAMSAAKRAAEKTGERLQPNQELAAIGFANIGSGLLGGFAVTGSLSKTAVAMESGGKTQIGNVCAAVLAVLTILYLTPCLEPIAHAALAALIIFVMTEVSDLPYFRRIWRIRRFEFIITLISFGAVLAIGAVAGVLVGAMLALGLLADHISRPPTAALGRTATGTFRPLGSSEGAEEIPGLLIWRLYGPLVFLNARRLSDDVRRELALREGVKVVLLDGGATSGIDSTGTTEFAKLRTDLADHGVELWVCGVREDILDRIRTTNEMQGGTLPRHFDTTEAAVTSFVQSDMA
jgi:SulP family sulfate permease